MKSNELKEIIRLVIREELDKTLPTLIPKILSEVLSGRQSSTIQSNQPIVSTKTVVKESVQKPKEIKKYSNNPVLNEILNQTVVKIPNEGSMAGLDSSFKSQAFAGMQMNESIETQQPVAPVTEEQGKVMNVLNRDFRSLMKAVDKKKQTGSVGSGMVSME
jgi:hypothetical protein